MFIPFGICNAPTTFMRIMNDVFRSFIDDSLIVYLDDILIFSQTWEDNVKQYVRQVLDVLVRDKFVFKDVQM